MPKGVAKNLLYGAALPLLGKKSPWKPSADGALSAFEQVIKRQKAVGASVQFFKNGKLSQSLQLGYACLEDRKPVEAKTCFRTASIAKTVTALLVMRLQTMGKLNVQQDIGELWGKPIRNPSCPDAPITLGMLLSHTSSIVDSPAYFASFRKPVPVDQLLQDEASYKAAIPGTSFCYSNFAAGFIGCLLEKITGISVEALAQKELFAPLGIQATYDITTLPPEKIAHSYRILPPGHAFNPKQRIESTDPILSSDPDTHYLLTSGNVYITAENLAKLALTAWNGADGFLNEESLHEMHTPIGSWPEKAIPLGHGMGLFCMDVPSVCPVTVWGHQGFAYGAVNGLFFDETGTGFVLLTSGASEARTGHLSAINLEMLRLLYAGEEHA